MNKLEATRRMAQWEVELRQLNIEYHPRTAIKAQALVDFIVKFTLPDDEKFQDDSKKWTIQEDGSLVKKRCRVGVVINTPKGEILKYGVQLQFPTTNNETEYETILIGLRVRKALGAKNILL